MRLEELNQAIEFCRDNNLPVPFLWNDKHLQIRDSTERNLLCYGSRDSSKSHSTAQKFVVKCRDPNYYFCGVMIRKHFNAIKDSQFKMIKQIIIDSGYMNEFYIRNHIYEIEHKTTGNMIIAKGLDKPDKIKSLTNPTMLWWEEPNTDKITMEDFIKFDTSLRGNRVEYFQNIFTFNSDSPKTWIYDYFFPDTLEYEKYLPEQYIVPTKTPNTKIIHFTYADNAFVQPASVERLNSLKDQHYLLYKVFALGLWGADKEGLIITDWKKINNYDLIQSNDISYGIDWGYKDPMTLYEIKQHAGIPYIKELFYERNKLPKDLIAFMNEHVVHKNSCIYPDPSRPDSCQELRDAGYNVMPVDNSILEGITSVQSVPLHVDSGAVNLFKELENYMWKIDKESGKPLDEPIESFNHGIDPTRYTLHNHYSFRERRFNY